MIKNTMHAAKQFLTIKEASHWASDFLKRAVSESNISYLIHYGKVRVILFLLM